MSIREILLSEALVEVSSGVGAAWSNYRVLGATRAGLALAKEPVGKSPERYKLVEPGTIFYNPMRIMIGSIAMVDDGEEPGITSPDYVVFRMRPGVLHHRWFYYWLRSKYGEDLIRSLARGAVRERLLFRRLARGAAELPNWDTQNAVALKLKTVSGIERSALESGKLLERLPAAHLRGVFEDLACRSWPTRKLNGIAEIVSGITLGRNLNGRGTSLYPYLRVANVKDGHLDLSDVVQTLATDREFERLKLQKGDLLLTEGGDRDKLGRGTIWRDEIPGCIHQNHIFRVRLDAGVADPEFVSFQAASSYGKAYFLRHAKQTTGIASINQRVLGAFPVMLPAITEQRRIAAELSSRMAAQASLAGRIQEQLDLAVKTKFALIRNGNGK